MKNFLMLRVTEKGVSVNVKFRFDSLINSHVWLGFMVKLSLNELFSFLNISLVFSVCFFNCPVVGCLNLHLKTTDPVRRKSAQSHFRKNIFLALSDQFEPIGLSQVSWDPNLDTQFE